ncbi:hypothetical protein OHS33_38120 (plasmid) [Streptomyces sp. NBC_00536]|uniref:hypothetical protein n=1 Tax=Streptomyces sp. NBC_00536 TaxID=2975769 RepID=UPI002E816C33|nr:hypothetical protein [Streptomyces sp. NBC_00536]WUC84219.1 hypothetical protein OHS33_38120 [Streptomyces sp. NBC_00536]
MNAILLAESPRTAFAESVLGRGEVEVVLLRLDSMPLSRAYLRRTAHVPTFTLDPGAALMDEAARYLRWVKGTKGLPRPWFVCGGDPEAGEVARRFGALVDLPELTPEQLAPVPVALPAAAGEPWWRDGRGLLETDLSDLGNSAKRLAPSA